MSFLRASACTERKTDEFVDLSYKVFDPKSNSHENKEMIIEKAKGDMNTRLSLSTESDVNE